MRATYNVVQIQLSWCFFKQKKYFCIEKCTSLARIFSPRVKRWLDLNPWWHILVATKLVFSWPCHICINKLDCFMPSSKFEGTKYESHLQCSENSVKLVLLLNRKKYFCIEKHTSLARIFSPRVKRWLDLNPWSHILVTTKLVFSSPLSHLH
jgi:hypothetical protein